MFLLSDILKRMNLNSKYRIENEKPFKYLALTASVLDEPSCIFIDNKRFTSNIPKHSSMILVTDEVAAEIDDTLYGLCIVEKPRELFFTMHNFLCNDKDYLRAKYITIVGNNCNISKHASIASHNVTIGNNVTIEEFTVIRENTVIGDNSIIRAGSVIGGIGFEFKRSKNKILPVTHVGGVILGDNVEIQYNTCIDKGIYPWNDTLIGNSCKIDNLVQIAHGVELGDNIFIAANSCVAGRTVIGENSWIGVGAIIINGLQIGAESNVNVGSVVFKSIKPNKTVLGNPAYDIEKYSKIQYELRELLKK